MPDFDDNDDIQPIDDGVEELEGEGFLGQIGRHMRSALDQMSGGIREVVGGVKLLEARSPVMIDVAQTTEKTVRMLSEDIERLQANVSALRGVEHNIAATGQATLSGMQRIESYIGATERGLESLIETDKAWRDSLDQTQTENAEYADSVGRVDYSHRTMREGLNELRTVMNQLRSELSVGVDMNEAYANSMEKIERARTMVLRASVDYRQALTGVRYSVDDTVSGEPPQLPGGSKPSGSAKSLAEPAKAMEKRIDGLIQEDLAGIREDLVGSIKRSLSHDKDLKGRVVVPVLSQLDTLLESELKGVSISAGAGGMQKKLDSVADTVIEGLFDSLKGMKPRTRMDIESVIYEALESHLSKSGLGNTFARYVGPVIQQTQSEDPRALPPGRPPGTGVVASGKIAPQTIPGSLIVRGASQDARPDKDPSRHGKRGEGEQRAQRELLTRNQRLAMVTEAEMNVLTEAQLQAYRDRLAEVGSKPGDDAEHFRRGAVDFAKYGKHGKAYRDVDTGEIFESDMERTVEEKIASVKKMRSELAAFSRELEKLGLSSEDYATMDEYYYAAYEHAHGRTTAIPKKEGQSFSLRDDPLVSVGGPYLRRRSSLRDEEYPAQAEVIASGDVATRIRKGMEFDTEDTLFNTGGAYLQDKHALEVGVNTFRAGLRDIVREVLDVQKLTRTMWNQMAGTDMDFGSLELLEDHFRFSGSAADFFEDRMEEVQTELKRAAPNVDRVNDLLVDMIDGVKSFLSASASVDSVLEGMGQGARISSAGLSDYLETLDAYRRKVMRIAQISLDMFPSVYDSYEERDTMQRSLLRDWTDTQVRGPDRQSEMQARRVMSEDLPHIQRQAGALQDWERGHSSMGMSVDKIIQGEMASGIHFGGMDINKLYRDLLVLNTGLIEFREKIEAIGPATEVLRTQYLGKLMHMMNEVFDGFFDFKNLMDSLSPGRLTQELHDLHGGLVRVKNGLVANLETVRAGESGMTAQLRFVTEFRQQLSELLPVLGRVRDQFDLRGGGDAQDLQYLADIENAFTQIERKVQRYSDSLAESGAVGGRQVMILGQMNNLFPDASSFALLERWVGILKGTIVPLDGIANRLRLLQHLVTGVGMKAVDVQTTVGNLKHYGDRHEGQVFAAGEWFHQKLEADPESKMGAHVKDMDTVKDITGYDLGNPKKAIQFLKEQGLDEKTATEEQLEAARDASVKAYREWLWKGIKDGEFQVKNIAKLYGRELMCFCDPLACHAHILSDAVDWAYNQLEQEAQQEILAGLPRKLPSESALEKVQGKVANTVRGLPYGAKFKGGGNQPIALSGKTQQRAAFVSTDEGVASVVAEVKMRQQVLDPGTGEVVDPDMVGGVPDPHIPGRTMPLTAEEQKKINLQRFVLEVRQTIAELLGVHAHQILEASTASDTELGKLLSPFILKIETPSGRLISVESLYHGSKIGETGGPHPDMYDMSPVDAKADPRLKEMGNVVGFDFFGKQMDVEGFFKYIYMNALFRAMPDIGPELMKYSAFTDMFMGSETNPEHKISEGGQAAALAMAQKLYKEGNWNEEFLKDPKNFSTERPHDPTWGTGELADRVMEQLQPGINAMGEEFKWMLRATVVFRESLFDAQRQVKAYMDKLTPKQKALPGIAEKAMAHIVPKPGEDPPDPLVITTPEMDRQVRLLADQLTAAGHSADKTREEFYELIQMVLRLNGVSEQAIPTLDQLDAILGTRSSLTPTAKKLRKEFVGLNQQIDALGDESKDAGGDVNRLDQLLSNLKSVIQTGDFEGKGLVGGGLSILNQMNRLGVPHDVTLKASRQLEQLGATRQGTMEYKMREAGIKPALQQVFETAEKGFANMPTSAATQGSASLKEPMNKLIKLIHEGDVEGLAFQNTVNNLIEMIERRSNPVVVGKAREAISEAYAGVLSDERGIVARINAAKDREKNFVKEYERAVDELQKFEKSGIKHRIEEAKARVRKMKAGAKRSRATAESQEKLLENVQKTRAHQAQKFLESEEAHGEYLERVRTRKDEVMEGMGTLKSSPHAETFAYREAQRQIYEEDRKAFEKSQPDFKPGHMIFPQGHTIPEKTKMQLDAWRMLDVGKHPMDKFGGTEWEGVVKEAMDSYVKNADPAFIKQTFAGHGNLPAVLSSARERGRVLGQLGLIEFEESAYERDKYQVPPQTEHARIAAKVPAAPGSEESRESAEEQAATEEWDKAREKVEKWHLGERFRLAMQDLPLSDLEKAEKRLEAQHQRDWLLFEQGEDPRKVRYEQNVERRTREKAQSEAFQQGVLRKQALEAEARAFLGLDAPDTQPAKPVEPKPVEVEVDKDELSSTATAMGVAMADAMKKRMANWDVSSNLMKDMGDTADAILRSYDIEKLMDLDDSSPMEELEKKHEKERNKMVAQQRAELEGLRGAQNLKEFRQTARYKEVAAKHRESRLSLWDAQTLEREGLESQLSDMVDEYVSAGRATPAYRVDPDRPVDERSDESVAVTKERRGKEPVSWQQMHEQNEQVFQKAIKMLLARQEWGIKDLGKSMEKALASKDFQAMIRGRDTTDSLLRKLFPDLHELRNQAFQAIPEFADKKNFSAQVITDVLKEAKKLLEVDDYEDLVLDIQRVRAEDAARVEARKKEVLGSDVYAHLQAERRVDPFTNVPKVEEEVDKVMTSGTQLKPDLDKFKALDVSGDTELLEKMGIAIVGNRDASKKALGEAQRLGSLFAKAGVNVVSGMARGIDSAAHIGALEAEGSTTIVPAMGLGKVGRSMNQMLSGLVNKAMTGVMGSAAYVSMFDKDQGFTGKGAMQRNDLVRALSEAVIVVQADKTEGGTYAMGEKALAEGKRLFVIDPKEMGGKGAGAKALIKQGATKVSLHDIREKGIRVFTQMGETEEERSAGRAEAGKIEQLLRVIGEQRKKAQQQLSKATAGQGVSGSGFVQQLVGLSARPGAGIERFLQELDNQERELRAALANLGVGRSKKPAKGSTTELKGLADAVKSESDSRLTRGQIEEQLPIIDVLRKNLKADAPKRADAARRRKSVLGWVQSLVKASTPEGLTEDQQLLVWLDAREKVLRGLLADLARKESAPAVDAEAMTGKTGRPADAKAAAKSTGRRVLMNWGDRKRMVTQQEIDALTEEQHAEYEAYLKAGQQPGRAYYENRGKLDEYMREAVDFHRFGADPKRYGKVQAYWDPDTGEVFDREVGGESIGRYEHKSGERAVGADSEFVKKPKKKPKEKPAAKPEADMMTGKTGRPEDAVPAEKPVVREATLPGKKIESPKKAKPAKSNVAQQVEQVVEKVAKWSERWVEIQIERLMGAYDNDVEQVIAKILQTFDADAPERFKGKPKTERRAKREALSSYLEGFRQKTRTAADVAKMTASGPAKWSEKWIEDQLNKGITKVRNDLEAAAGSSFAYEGFGQKELLDVFGKIREYWKKTPEGARIDSDMLDRIFVRVAESLSARDYEGDVDLSKIMRKGGDKAPRQKESAEAQAEEVQGKQRFVDIPDVGRKMAGQYFSGPDLLKDFDENAYTIKLYELGDAVGDINHALGRAGRKEWDLELGKDVPSDLWKVFSKAEMGTFRQASKTMYGKMGRIYGAADDVAKAFEAGNVDALRSALQRASAEVTSFAKAYLALEPKLGAMEGKLKPNTKAMEEFVLAMGPFRMMGKQLVDPDFKPFADSEKTLDNTAEATEELTDEMKQLEKQTDKTTEAADKFDGKIGTKNSVGRSVSETAERVERLEKKLRGLGVQLKRLYDDARVADEVLEPLMKRVESAQGVRGRLPEGQKGALQGWGYASYDERKYDWKKIKAFVEKEEDAYSRLAKDIQETVAAANQGEHDRLVSKVLSGRVAEIGTRIAPDKTKVRVAGTQGLLSPHDISLAEFGARAHQMTGQLFSRMELPPDRMGRKSPFYHDQENLVRRAIDAVYSKINMKMFLPPWFDSWGGKVGMEHWFTSGAATAVQGAGLKRELKRQGVRPTFRESPILGQVGYYDHNQVGRVTRSEVPEIRGDAFVVYLENQLMKVAGNFRDALNSAFGPAIRKQAAVLAGQGKPQLQAQIAQIDAAGRPEALAAVTKDRVRALYTQISKALSDDLISKDFAKADRRVLGQRRPDPHLVSSMESYYEGLGITPKWKPTRHVRRPEIRLNELIAELKSEIQGFVQTLRLDTVTELNLLERANSVGVGMGRRGQHWDKVEAKAASLRDRLGTIAESELGPMREQLSKAYPKFAKQGFFDTEVLLGVKMVKHVLDDLGQTSGKSSKEVAKLVRSTLQAENAFGGFLPAAKAVDAILGYDHSIARNARDAGNELGRFADRADDAGDEARDLARDLGPADAALRGLESGQMAFPGIESLLSRQLGRPDTGKVLIHAAQSLVGRMDPKVTQQSYEMGTSERRQHSDMFYMGATGHQWEQSGIDLQTFVGRLDELGDHWYRRITLDKDRAPSEFPTKAGLEDYMGDLAVPWNRERLDPHKIDVESWFTPMGWGTQGSGPLDWLESRTIGQNVLAGGLDRDFDPRVWYTSLLSDVGYDDLDQVVRINKGGIESVGAVPRGMMGMLGGEPTYIPGDYSGELVRSVRELTNYLSRRAAMGTQAPGDVTLDLLDEIDQVRRLGEVLPPTAEGLLELLNRVKRLDAVMGTLLPTIQGRDVAEFSGVPPETFAGAPKLFGFPPSMEREVRAIRAQLDFLDVTAENTGKSLGELVHAELRLKHGADAAIPSIKELDAYLGTGHSLIPTTDQLKDNMKALSNSIDSMGGQAAETGAEVSGELDTPLVKFMQHVKDLESTVGAGKLGGMAPAVSKVGEKFEELLVIHKRLQASFESGELTVDEFNTQYEGLERRFRSIRGMVLGMGTSLVELDNETKQNVKSTEAYARSISSASAQLTMYEHHLTSVEETYKRVKEEAVPKPKRPMYKTPGRVEYEDIPTDYGDVPPDDAKPAKDDTKPAKKTYTEHLKPVLQTSFGYGLKPAVTELFQVGEMEQWAETDVFKNLTKGADDFVKKIWQLRKSFKEYGDDTVDAGSAVALHEMVDKLDESYGYLEMMRTVLKQIKAENAFEEGTEEAKQQTRAIERLNAVIDEYGQQLHATSKGLGFDRDPNLPWEKRQVPSKHRLFRQRDPAKGDMERVKDEKTGRADFQHMSFVDLFASMQHLEQVYFHVQQVVEITAEFGFQMSRVGGITGAVGQEFKTLETIARRMGSTTIYTARESAEAMEELAKVGLTASEIISTLPSVLNVAAAEGMELAKAAEILSANIKAFQLETTEAARVSNVMAAASMQSAATMEDFGVGLRTVATFAHSAGVSVEETVALLGKLADAGMTPNKGATALRQMIQQFQRLERGGASRELARIGLTMADIDPNIVGLTTAMFRLHAAIEKSGSDIDKIFTLKASQAFQELTKVGEDAVRGLQTNITGTQAASELAERQMDTFYGMLKKTRSAYEEFQISIGIGTEPLIGFFAGIARSVMGFVSSLSDGGKQAVGTISLIGATVFGLMQLGAILTYSQGLVLDQWKAIYEGAVKATKAVWAFFKANLAVTGPVAALALVAVGVYAIVKGIQAQKRAEEERVRRFREQVREELNLRGKLITKIENQKKRLEDLQFTMVEQRQVHDAAARVGDLTVEFDKLGNVIFESQQHLMEMLDVMRRGELEFPALKKMEEQLSMLQKQYLTTSEMVDILSFMRDVGGDKIDISQRVKQDDGSTKIVSRFETVFAEFDETGQVFFTLKDGTKLLGYQMERVIEVMKEYEARGRRWLSVQDLGTAKENRESMMVALRDALLSEEYLQAFAQQKYAEDPEFAKRAQMLRVGQVEGQGAIGVSEYARRVLEVGPLQTQLLSRLEAIMEPASLEIFQKAWSMAESQGLDAAYKLISTLTQGLRGDLAEIGEQHKAVLVQAKLPWDKAVFEQAVSDLITAFTDYNVASLKRIALADEIVLGSPAAIMGESTRGIGPGTARGRLKLMESREAAAKDYFGMQRYVMEPFTGKVESVVDGDTIKITLPGGGKSEIRFSSVNTRESNQGDQPEPWSLEAKQFAEDFIGKIDGVFRDVQIVDFRGGETYGRQVADVVNLEGKRLSRELVRKGLARVTEFPSEFREEYMAIQHKAMRAQLGIWSKGNDRFWTQYEKRYMTWVVENADKVAEPPKEVSAALEAGTTVLAAKQIASAQPRLPTPDIPGVKRLKPTRPIQEYAPEIQSMYQMWLGPTMQNISALEDLSARSSWIRNQFRSKKLDELQYLLRERLSALAEIDAGRKSAQYMGPSEERDEVLKDISQLLARLKEEMQQADEKIWTMYSDWIKHRLGETGELLDDVIRVDDVPYIRDLAYGIGAELERLKSKGLLEPKGEQEVYDDLSEKYHALLKEIADASADLYADVITRYGENWVYNVKAMLKDTDITDPAGLLVLTDRLMEAILLLDDAEELQADGGKLRDTVKSTKEEIKAVADKGVTDLLTALGDRLTYNLEDLTSTQILTRIGPGSELARFYDMVEDAGVLDDAAIKDVNERILRLFRQLADGAVRAATRDLDSLDGWASHENRLAGLDELTDSLADLKTRFQGLPKVLWDRIFQGLDTSIEDASTAVQKKIASMIREEVTADMEADPTLKLEDILKSYGYLMDLLGPDISHDLITEFGADIDKVREGVEQNIRERFAESIRAMGDGLTGFQEIMPGEQAMYFKLRREAFRSRLRSEARRRSIKFGGPAIDYFKELMVEFKDTDFQFESATRKLRADRYASRLAGRIARLPSLSDLELEAIIPSLDAMKKHAETLGMSVRNMNEYMALHAPLFAAASAELGKRRLDLRTAVPPPSKYPMEMGFPDVGMSKVGEAFADYVTDETDGWAAVMAAQATDPGVVAGTVLQVTDTLTGAIFEYVYQEVEGIRREFKAQTADSGSKDKMHLGAKLRAEGYIRPSADISGVERDQDEGGGKADKDIIEQHDEQQEPTPPPAIKPGPLYTLPFMRSASRYQSDFFKREEARIKREKLEVKDLFAQQAKDRIDSGLGLPKSFKQRTKYEEKSAKAKLDLELQFLKDFQQNQSQMREALSSFQNLLATGGPADKDGKPTQLFSTVLPESFSEVFADLLAVEAQLDLSQHLIHLGETAERVAQGMQGFVQRTDQAGSVIKVFSKLLDDEAGKSMQVFVGTLGSVVTSLARGDEPGGVAATGLGAAVGGFLGYMAGGQALAGAQIGGSLGGSLWNAFTDRDELEDEAEDSVNGQSASGSRVDVRNTTVHIGSIVYETTMEIREEVDVEKLSEDLTLLTESKLREIVV